MGCTLAELQQLGGFRLAPGVPGSEHPDAETIRNCRILPQSLKRTESLDISAIKC